MKEEIVGGIRNAMERGASLEEAGQSFLNAGYNPHEVKEAEKIVSEEIGDKTPEKVKSIVPKNEKQILPKEQGFEATKKKKGLKIILVAVIILALLVFIGALSYLVYTLIK